MEAPMVRQRKGAGGNLRVAGRARAVSDDGMRRHLALLLSLFPLACSTPAHLVSTAKDRALSDGAAAHDLVMDVGMVADELATADLVALGELHETPAVHGMHLELVQALHERCPRMVVALEMFERDTQTLLLRYLNGFVPESTFLQQARAWPHYERDYRPLVEFCKANGIVVLAANAPRKLAAQVVTDGGAQNVLGNRDVARETTAPEDDYFEAFREEMKGHPGLSDAKLHAYYASQCLKDDTMAESITDHLKQSMVAGKPPLCVLVCGKMHSDFGRGTVARIKSRMPELKVKVVSAEEVDDLDAGTYTSPRTVGDFVVLVPKTKREAMVMPMPKAKPTAPNPHDAKPAAPVATKPAANVPAVPTPPAAAATDTEGLRPALGFMPEYNEEAGGVVVGALREGGPAEKAGMEQGDVIVMLNGTKVADVASYQEVLDELKIGKQVPVRVKRDGAEVELQVTVGSRAARR